ncbi:MAG TPA: hypothetical protein PKD64_15960 [Pirellulaceae bacterium]|nr:hypothetical protein [Pirellulaceae bacterium]HMO93683.1 hypothetical protein [Pirellulaceae bacterium]HMP68425.1 hypothetical protein [Pirellulaceae bacterium]
MLQQKNVIRLAVCVSLGLVAAASASPQDTEINDSALVEQAKQLSALTGKPIFAIAGSSS